jgi:hypothetical protein
LYNIANKNKPACFYALSENEGTLPPYCQFRSNFVILKNFVEESMAAIAQSPTANKIGKSLSLLLLLNFYWCRRLNILPAC